MGLLNDSQRAARERMSQAEKAARRTGRGLETDAAGTPLPRRPQRYRLYDRIKDRVSVSTMNVIIGATVLLLVIALIIGIATGTPQ